VHEIIQAHRRYLIELMQEWTRLKEGPSGSGKSSLRTIAGTLEEPISGAVLITGQDDFGLPANAPICPAGDCIDNPLRTLTAAGSSARIRRALTGVTVARQALE
jgi:energy-coupling factor transporter ATP-binding protein EcfA2